MIIMRKGINPPPMPWWHGLKLECNKCAEVVMLQKGDQDRASVCIEDSEHRSEVSYRCENCGNIITKQRPQ